MKTNTIPTMPKAAQSKMLAASPRQYAGANGSLGKGSKAIKDFHNTKGKVKRKVIFGSAKFTKKSTPATK
jgi:hypothetical protein